MNPKEDSLAYESLKKLEDVARKECEGKRLVDGSSAAGRFLVHQEGNDSILLTCEREGSDITISVAVFPPEGIRSIYKRTYVVTDEGMQHPNEENIVLSPAEAMNSALLSFESGLTGNY